MACRHIFIALNIKACITRKLTEKKSVHVISPVLKEFARVNEVFRKMAIFERNMRMIHRRIESYRFTKTIRLLSLVRLLERLDSVMSNQSSFFTQPIERLSKSNEQRRKNLLEVLHKDW